MEAESEVTPKEEVATERLTQTEGPAQGQLIKQNEHLLHPAGFHRIQVTLGLTLGFLYSEGGSLPNGVNRHGNLYCRRTGTKSPSTDQSILQKKTVTPGRFSAGRAGASEGFVFP